MTKATGETVVAQNNSVDSNVGQRSADFIKSAMRTTVLVSLTPYLLLILVMLVMTIGNSKFLTPMNLETMAVQVSGLLIMALGITFVILMGSIDISFAEIANFVSVVIALTVGQIGYLAFPLGILAGAFAGLLNGLIFIEGRLPSLVVTLGMMGFWTGLAYTLSGGPPVEMHRNNQYLTWVTGTTLGLPNEALIALVLVVICFVILSYTWYGRSLYAIGAGEVVARLSGVRVDGYKIIAFIISGTFAAIGGIILAARTQAGSPVLSAGYLLYVLACVVVGGTALSGGMGGAHRTLVGALIITMLRNGMNVVGVDAYAQQVVVGVVLIIAVILTLDRSKIPIIK